MTTSEFKIFYSWQSDLPGNQTRNLIQNSINNAVKVMRDTVEIQADRDTKGEFGSPDIVQTIFTKIDECDLFIADVSIVNNYRAHDEDGNLLEEVRTTPNPNVLLELGYAAKTLGWDRVICIVDTDFGDLSELPFDIRHRRLTPYSLDGKSKADVKHELTGIIVATIVDLLKNGTVKRAKGQFAYHIVGSYDFNKKLVVEEVHPFTIGNLPGYRNERDKILMACKDLISKISLIHLQPFHEMEQEKKTEGSESTSNEGSESTSNEKVFNTLDAISFRLQKKDLFEEFKSPRLVTITEDDVQKVTQQIKGLFQIDLPDDFFCMGNLQEEVKDLLTPMQSSDYSGTDEEEQKYKYYQELKHHLLRMELIDKYIQTFDGMIIIPLAIVNASFIKDSEITVAIKVDDTAAEVILPTAYLFNEEIKGLEGYIYNDEILKNLFLMVENSEIQYDTDISYDINEKFTRMRKETAMGLWQQYPHFDSSDYEMELKKYIASPRESRTCDFEFTIGGLRPKEAKWLGAAILLRPKQEKVVLDYSIKSSNSNGELCGVLEFDSLLP